MNRSGERKVPMNVVLDKDERAFVEREATRRRVSRGQVVRDAVHFFMTSNSAFHPRTIDDGEGEDAA